MPQIKTFVWKLAHRKLVTRAYLYHSNIVPHTLCPFYSLSEETASHLIWNFSKVAHQWHLLLPNLGLNPAVLSSFQNVSWLTSSFKVKVGDSWVKAIVATLAWLIWKERCNWTFKSRRPNFNSLLPTALNTCANFFKASRFNYREYSNLMANQISISVYTDASWNIVSKLAGLGFVILANPGNILIVGSNCSLKDSPI